jgi:hypothetical protein
MAAKSASAARADMTVNIELPASGSFEVIVIGSIFLENGYG